MEQYFHRAQLKGLDGVRQGWAESRAQKYQAEGMRVEERMDGQRCILWVFLVKMQGGFSVNLFEKRGQ